MELATQPSPPLPVVKAKALATTHAALHPVQHSHGPLNMARSPMPVVLFIIHVLCEVPVHMKQGSSLPSAILQAVLLSSVVCTTYLLVLHTNWRSLSSLLGGQPRALRATHEPKRMTPQLLTPPTKPGAATAATPAAEGPRKISADAATPAPFLPPPASASGGPQEANSVGTTHSVGTTPNSARPELAAAESVEDAQPGARMNVDSRMAGVDTQAAEQSSAGAVHVQAAHKQGVHAQGVHTHAVGASGSGEGSPAAAAAEPAPEAAGSTEGHHAPSAAEAEAALPPGMAIIHNMPGGFAEGPDSGSAGNKLRVVPHYTHAGKFSSNDDDEAVRSQESNVRLQLEQINQMVQQKHVYTSRFRRYKVDLKIPGQLDHNLLPADALPQIVSLLSERDITQRITGTAVRHGCIIVALHVSRKEQQLHHHHHQQQQQQQATEAIVCVVKQWLRDTGLLGGVPPGTTLTVQVEDQKYGLSWLEAGQAWLVHGPTSVDGSGFSIQTTLPACLLPRVEQRVTWHHPTTLTQPQLQQQPYHQQQQQQQQPQQQQQQQMQGRELLVPIRVSVQQPAGPHARPLTLVGWSPDPAAKAASPATPTTPTDGFTDQPEALSVLACVRGRYLRTRVGVCDTVTGGEREGEAWDKGTADSSGSHSSKDAVESPGLHTVWVSVPAEMAVGTALPQVLHVELWSSRALLSSSPTLLLPAHMRCLAAELQALPWGELGQSRGAHDFLLDVEDWLCQQQQQQQACSCSRRSSSSSSSIKECHAEGLPTGLWELGCALARQSVLWGMPALASLLVECLMSLPSAPPSPFSHLARAHEHDQPSSNEDATAHLGGLLHLSLLSPCSTPMLWTVLDWGKRWCMQDAAGTDAAALAEPRSFPWQWEERSAAGHTPLELLAQLPQRTALLQQLRGHRLLPQPLPRVTGSSAPCTSARPSRASTSACEAARPREADKACWRVWSKPGFRSTSCTTPQSASTSLLSSPSKAAGLSADEFSWGVLSCISAQASRLSRTLGLSPQSSVCEPPPATNPSTSPPKHDTASGPKSGSASCGYCSRCSGKCGGSRLCDVGSSGAVAATLCGTDAAAPLPAACLPCAAPCSGGDACSSKSSCDIYGGTAGVHAECCSAAGVPAECSSPADLQAECSTAGSTAAGCRAAAGSAVECTNTAGPLPPLPPDPLAAIDAAVTAELAGSCDKTLPTSTTRVQMLLTQASTSTAPPVQELLTQRVGGLGGKANADSEGVKGSALCADISAKLLARSQMSASAVGAGVCAAPASASVDAAASCRSRSSIECPRSPGKPCVLLELEFNEWCGRQNNRLALMWAAFHMALMLLSALRSLHAGNLAGDMQAIAVWLAPHLAVVATVPCVQALGWPQVYVEVCTACVLLARVLSFLAYGLDSRGLGMGFPPASSCCKALMWRTDVLLELILGPQVEQVRISWLLPIRIMMVAPLALYYSGSGFRWPVAQAAIVLGTSVAMSLHKDLRLRRTFLAHHKEFRRGSHCACRHRPGAVQN